jgi:sugar phosphate isomerase/epimerase
LEPIIPINTLAYHGYDIPTAIDEIAKFGTGYVELVFMVDYYRDLSEEVFTTWYARNIKNIIKTAGLQNIGLSAHMDLGKKNSVSSFKKRMEFAKEIGANIIITNACLKKDSDIFLKNIEQLATFAKSIGMIIALENPGADPENIIKSGKAGVSLLEKIGSDVIKINYDTSNVYSNSKGAMKPEEDIKHILSYVTHLHLKDLKQKNNGWYYSGIGEGVINYNEIFNNLSELDQLPPMSIELPLRFRFDSDFNFIRDHLQLPLPLFEIRNILERSINYIKNNLCN